ncbi:raffinose/stachyose/melibiose transport system permease protein [Enterococcus sp. PF1-24]|uniref:carbohydrate ABC transporter permease n=1 Tax=unclassified Enterococcus TaxID=2608891 RepID=UPI002474998C|nr:MULTISPECIES: sugar ABC transporter permease [unclassified Enterococcus]MDH6363824.1 raffinose/stachyose/melibiose transport system permease protein [Enterococcus sp. PFB1-1]MDH6400990.1 raffinose/stachyose/melibiose transport system permease protein [Enterococcus sp. PF1-24]
MVKQKKSWFYIFAAPVTLALIAVVIVPFIYGIYYSFSQWNGVSKETFVGLDNYIQLFSDKNFWSAMIFTVKFAVISIILTNIIGLGLAMLVTSKFKGANFLRTIFFMPNLIGGLILGFIWQFIFINAFSAIGDVIGNQGLKTWLSTTQTGFWALIIVMCWQMSGYIMVIYISYLQSVDESLLEAADLDGASTWQKFWNIKLPLIMPGFTVSLFMTLSNSFKLYDQNLSLTNGGPYNSTQMVAMNIYNTAFGENKMGYAQAKAVVFFVIVAAISLTQVYLTKRKEVEA